MSFDRQCVYACVEAYVNCTQETKGRQVESKQENKQTETEMLLILWLCCEFNGVASETLTVLNVIITS